MKFKNLIIGVAGLGLFWACVKNATPVPPVHDTVTVHKTDTLIKTDTLHKTDTLYATKPDSTVNLTKGLLLYLNFTGNIADSSGNNNPTVAIGNVLTYDMHGYSNNAFGATGNAERVIVTNNGSIQFDTAYSLAFGFMVNDLRGCSFMSLVNNSNGDGPTFNLGTTLPSMHDFDMAFADNTAGCNNSGAGEHNLIWDTTAFVPNPGSWYNAICIYHKAIAQIYINGQLISTKRGPGSTALLCPSSQFIVGGWWGGDPQSMNGKLDNIRLYNRVLTPHEIVQLSSNYQVNSNSQRPGLQTH